MKGGAVAADGRIEPGDMLLQVLLQILPIQQNMIEQLAFSSSYIFGMDIGVFEVLKRPLWKEKLIWYI